MIEFKEGRNGVISLKDYHKMEGWSKSALDKVHQSMAHCFEYFKSKDEPTDAVLFGQALHCRILTPDLFDSEFYVWQKQNRTTKEGKAAWAEAVISAGSKTIINNEMMDNINSVSDSILKHPIAGNLLKDGAAEQSFFWIDRRTGLKCKARPDYFRVDNIVIDIKKAVDASYFAFQRAIVDYRYYVQGAYFCDGVSAVEKTPVNTFILIAAEPEPPYNVAVYNLDADSLRVGRTAYEADLDKVVEYEKSVEKWAGYPLFIQDMLLPAWVN